MTEDLQQTGEIGAAETVAAEAPTAEAPAAEVPAAEVPAAEVQAETAAAGEAPAAAEKPAAKAVANSKKTRAPETKTEAPAEPEPEAAAGQETAAAEPAAAAVEPQPVRNENFRWYILHAYSGFERKVRESIESRVQAFGLKERVGRVMIPTEPVTEIVNGKKRTVERVFLPGYVLVEMELDNELWHVLKDTPKVTGFLGTGDKPVALSEEEVSSILFRSETSKDKPRMKIKFEKSEQVRITDGPFANFNGVVDEVNEDRETLKVMVTIFGRSTPVELEFGKVEKIE
jgi:transcriptional antiterminator NusG